MLVTYATAFWDSLWGGDPIVLVLSLVDIALVWFFIYKFLVLIKGTRSMRILAGFFLLVALYFVGKLVGMRAMVWLLGGILEYFIIIVVVIFRDEIRSILSSFEFIRMLGSDRATYESMLMSEELAEALSNLAQNRDGAIVVVAQKGDPEPFVTGGVPLGAEVKKELLISIFRKNTPLHDGAVVIREGRIALAGVVLPLSTNPDIDVNFGTRHRAAYGISERVDALVFVVSEERGQISLLKDGRITRNMTKEMIKRMLTKHLSQD
ncbi:MAG TPA: diadenylate cyclase CdaA [bacterium]|nr:diadenylate cyclase CdaA [bacterium]